MSYIPSTGRNRSRHLATVLVWAVLLLGLGACQVTDAVDKAIAAVGQTTSTIQQESSAWRNELPQLQTNLESLIRTESAGLSAEARSLLTDATTEIGALAKDTVELAGLTAEQLIARFGTELRCNADFARSRVTASLRTLADRMAFWKKNGRVPDPPKHSVCQVTPNSMEVRATGGAGTDGWTLTSPENKIVGVYGYDFRYDAVPSVDLVDAAGTRVRAATVAASYVTRYQINLDFGTEKLQSVKPGTHFVLRWPDQPDPNSIALTVIRPSDLKIVSVDLDPVSPRAKVSAVQVTVMIENRGGSASEPFVATWTPGPNQPVQSATVGSVVAGGQKRFTLPAYTYPQHGVFEYVVLVGGGSDSRRGTVTVTPYATVPHTQSVPMNGTWPGGGGEPGQTLAFDAVPIFLGRECVIDPARGGGSFTVDDIFDPSIKHRVAWDAGYDFGFGPGTFWRSLSSVSATYDAQLSRVTGRVTLKGLGSHGTFGSRGPERFDGTFTVYSLCPS